MWTRIWQKFVDTSRVGKVSPSGNRKTEGIISWIDIITGRGMFVLIGQRTSPRTEVSPFGVVPSQLVFSRAYPLDLCYSAGDMCHRER